jgi:asparagine synthase (glutamine-hydrolysing)
MCGIAGIVGLDQPEAAGAIERMSNALAHRGPDGRGTWTDRTLAFGHRRLAILDLSDAGLQPMRTPDGRFTIVHNGEVYNFRDVVRTLERERGFAARTTTDTEVILHAYAAWGGECVTRLRGMFAFAIWDAQERRLFVARDRVGIKPLYYWSDGERLVFASEMRAVLASGLVRRRLDPIALDQYLAYQAPPAPRTLVEGVRFLPPGHTLTAEADGAIRVARYWDALDNAEASARDEDPARARTRVRELLRESIALHMISDVPVGAFLSGGVDSSAIVALMREAGCVPRTFTVVFAERAYNEAAHARAVATACGAEHTEILLTDRDLLDRLPEAMAALDHASGDAVNTYVISRAVRDAGIKVALSGLGGDEVFGGYPIFSRVLLAASPLRLWGKTPRPVRHAAARAYRAVAAATVGSDKIASVIESDADLASVLPVNRQVLSRRQRHELLAPEWLVHESEADPYQPLLRRAFAAAPVDALMARVSYAELRTYMHDVLLRDADQMSMSRALELRVPLLDHRVIEYVIGLSDDVKRPAERAKPLLADAVARPLPASTVGRRKQGFTLPFDLWMRGELRAYCGARLGARRLGGRGVFRADALGRYWRAFLEGRRHFSWSRLWVLVALEEWLDRNAIETYRP